MSKVLYYGKYRAIVVDIDDPEKRGRIRVQCPKVLGNSKSPWCEACVPVAYDNGGDFFLPKVNETVWVEFEEGDTNKPIYTGNWWSINNTPVKNSYSNKKRIINFDGGSIIFNSQTDLEITMFDSSIKISEEGVKIVSPLITLSSEGSSITVSSGGVNINGPRINLN